MRISSREVLMAWLTGVAVLAGLTFWFVEPRWERFSYMSRQIEVAQRKMERDRQLIDSRDQWDDRMQGLRRSLTKYPRQRDLTAEYLKLIERLAKENNLTLVQRRPDREKTQGGLYELSINCTWEGDLDALVRFLYTLDQQDVTMNVEELSVSTVPGKKEQLRGSFTLICAYTRDDTE